MSLKTNSKTLFSPGNASRRAPTFKLATLLFPVFFLPVLLLIFEVPSSEAQNSPNFTKQSAPTRTSYYGMTQEQIGERFGKPDSERKKDAGNTEWVYGRSSIFFMNNKVTAWSDVGELSQRERIRTLKAEKPSVDDSLSATWQNPWTPPGRGSVSADNLEMVVDD